MKAKIFFVTLLFFFGVLQLQAQTNYADWVKTFENAEAGNDFTNILFDGQDYILNGYYYYGADFNGITLPENGSANSIITKVDDNGEPIWTSTIEGSGMDIFYDMSLNSENDIILVGWTSTNSVLNFNGVSFFEGNGEYIDRSMVVKISGVDGSLIWSKFFNGAQYEIVYSTNVAVDEQDNIYVGGYYNCPFQVDDISIPYNHQDGNDLFMLKFDTDGNAIWGQYFAAESEEGYAEISSVIVNDESVYFSFQYSIPLVINGVALPHTGMWYWLAVAKASKETGVVEAVNPFGSNGITAIQQIKFDNENNILAVGFFDNYSPLTIGTFTINGLGDDDGYFFKMDNNLEVLWAKQLGNQFLDGTYNVQVDESNNYFIGGMFYNGANLSYDGLDVLDANVTSSYSLFYLMTDEDGTFIQSTGLYGDEAEISMIIINSSSVVTNGNMKEVFCVGWFTNMVTFVQGEQLLGSSTGFLYKWSIPFVTVSTEESDFNSLMGVFPNPVNDFLWIKPAGNNAKIEIYNLLGILVYTDEIESTTQVSMEMLPSGNYLVKISSEKIAQTFNILKN